MRAECDFLFSDGDMESKEATALFIGNRDCYHVSRTAIEKAITKAIESGIKVFLNGGQGYFDKMCASVLYQLKKVYPQVKSYLVIPYQEFIDYNKDLYDEIIFPFKEQSQTYYFYKRAVPYRNKYMNMQSPRSVMSAVPAEARARRWNTQKQKGY